MFNYNFIPHTEASEVSEELKHTQLCVISVIKPTWLHSRASLTRPSARLLSAPLNANASDEANEHLPDAPRGPSAGKKCFFFYVKFWRIGGLVKVLLKHT